MKEKHNLLGSEQYLMSYTEAAQLELQHAAEHTAELSRMIAETAVTWLERVQQSMSPQEWNEHCNKLYWRWKVAKTVLAEAVRCLQDFA